MKHGKATLRDGTNLDSATLPLAYFGELPMSVGPVLATTDTDGWMLLHRGRELTEQNFGEMAAPTQHLMMSMSKLLGERGGGGAVRRRKA